MAFEAVFRGLGASFSMLLGSGYSSCAHLRGLTRCIYPKVDLFIKSLHTHAYVDVCTYMYALVICRHACTYARVHIRGYAGACRMVTTPPNPRASSVYIIPALGPTVHTSALRWATWSPGEKVSSTSIPVSGFSEVLVQRESRERI